ncbi:MAG: hypothetical protein H0U06_08215 [Solirubrobacterales bacterium]|nr:hypothetical protein [Solirubrobacterales bacterium]
MSNGDQQECGADAEGGRVGVDLGAAEQLVARPLNDSTSGHCQWIKDGWAVGYRFEP